MKTPCGTMARCSTRIGRSVVGKAAAMSRAASIRRSDHSKTKPWAQIWSAPFHRECGRTRIWCESLHGGREACGLGLRQELDTRWPSGRLGHERADEGGTLAKSDEVSREEEAA